MRRDNIEIKLAPTVKPPFVAIEVAPKFRYGTDEQIGFTIDCVIPSAKYDTLKVTIETDRPPLDPAAVAAQPVEVVFDGLTIIPYSLPDRNNVEFTAKATGVRRYNEK